MGYKEKAEGAKRMGAQRAYLISGGPSMDRSVMIQDLQNAFIDCDSLSPHIAYVGSASRDNRLFYAYMKHFLTKAGAHSVEMLPLSGREAQTHKIQARRAKAAHILNQSDVIFLSGGEPEEGMNGLKRFGLDTVLRDLYEHGKLFIGVSAGAIMMGQHWIHRNEKHKDETAHLIDCLGFFPQTFDAHGEAENWKDLRCALSLLEEGEQACGLATNGCYCIDSEGKLSSLRNEPVWLSA